MKKVVRSEARTAKTCAWCPKRWGVGSAFDFVNSDGESRSQMVCVDCGDKFVGSGKGYRDNAEEKTAPKQSSEAFGENTANAARRVDESITAKPVYVTVEEFDEFDDNHREYHRGLAEQFKQALARIKFLEDMLGVTEEKTNGV